MTKRQEGWPSTKWFFFLGGGGVGVGGNKMAALTSDWLRHFRLLWNCRTEFHDETKESNISISLTNLFFGTDRKTKTSRLGIPLAETFSTSSLTPLNRIWWRKNSMSSTKFVVLGPIRNTRWPGLLLADTFLTFSLKPPDWNLKKLDRKWKLNVLYQLCVCFGQIRKPIWPPWPLIDWDIFDYSSETT